MQVVKIPLDKLVEAEWNPNEMDEFTFNRLVDELREIGLIDPIQVVPLEDGRYRVIGGNHRLRAARVLGWNEIDCVVLTDVKFQSEDLQKFLTVRLNVLRGKLNPEKFIGLYNEMVEKYGKEAMRELMGFTDRDAFNKLINEVEKNIKTAMSPGLAKKFQKVKKEIKTLNDLGNILNKLFSEYGETIERNFMYFSYGGREHLYIICNRKLWRLVNSLMDYINKEKLDASEVFSDMIFEYIEKIGVVIKGEESI